MSLPVSLEMFRQVVSYVWQFGQFQRNARLYLFSYALSGVSAGIILVLYNLYLDALGYDTGFIGLLLFAGTLGAGLAIFPAGFCYDRFGGKRLLIWASVGIGIAGAGQLLFREPVLLFSSVFLLGVGAAFLLVVNAPFLTAHSTPLERPHLFSLNIVVTLIATVLGEVVGGAIPVWLRSMPWFMTSLPHWLNWMLVEQTQARSYQLTLLFAGIIAAPSFVPLFLMDDDRPFRSAQGLASGRQSSIALRSLLITSRRLQTWWGDVDKRSLLTGPFFVMIAVWGLIGLGAGMFIPYFNLYFVSHLGAHVALFGVLDAIANGMNALGTLLAPLVALRAGQVATILVPRLIALPLMLLLGVTSILPLAAVLYPLRQGFMDMSQGILQVFSMEVVTRERRGVANSSYQVANQVAWAIGTPIGGFLIKQVGYSSVFICASLLYLTAFVLFWLRFGRGTKKRMSDEGTNVEAGQESSAPMEEPYSSHT